MWLSSRMSRWIVDLSWGVLSFFSNPSCSYYSYPIILYFVAMQKDFYSQATLYGERHTVYRPNVRYYMHIAFSFYTNITDPSHTSR
jgi:hypothetical protein